MRVLTFLLDTLFIFYSSFILIIIFEIIAAKPPVVIPEEKIFLIVSGNCIRISGYSSTPSPILKLMAITNVALRSICCEAIIFTPAEATVPNISKVAPPSTGSGINENITPIIGKNPSSTRNKAIK